MTGRSVQMKRFGHLLLTRERGRRVAADLPRRKELILDFDRVEAASPSFLDEVLRRLQRKGTTSVILLNVTDRTAETVKRLRRVEESPARDLELQVG